jgi:hypothetical protein
MNGALGVQTMRTASIPKPTMTKPITKKIAAILNVLRSVALSDSGMGCKVAKGLVRQLA